MITFIHTADIHFGMENYGKTDPATGIHTRLLDFEKALNHCIDYGIKENIDFFLFAGDAYKTAHPTPTHQRLLLNCFLKLYKAGIPIVMLVGNHDHPLSYGKAHALEIFNQMPLKGFHVIAKPETIVLETKSGPVQIVGIPWPTRNTLALNSYSNAAAADITKLISSSITTIIKHHAQALDPDLPAVLSGHLTVSSAVFSGSEKRAVYGTDPLFMPSQLGIPPFDYVALGHLHRFQDLNKSSYPPVVYSGSIERIDFGERKEEKGFCLVKLHNKAETTYEFIKVPTRPFIQIEVHLQEALDQTEQVLQELTRYNLKDAVIKIIYFVPATQKDRVDIGKIQKACIHAHYLVGIIPIRNISVREKRNSLQTDMNVMALLESYFSSKLEYKKQKNRLLEKAEKLYNQNNS